MKGKPTARRPSRPRRAAPVDPLVAMASRFFETIERDRKDGVTLWLCVVFAEDMSTYRAGYTAAPEDFLPLVCDGTAPGVEQLPRPEVGLPVLMVPIRLAELPDADLAAVVTLPRERLFTSAELIAHGIPMARLAPDRVAEVADRLSRVWGETS